MNHSEEPLPGSFVWRLLETDAQGKTPKIFRSAFDAADDYELALSTGQSALKSEIRRRSPNAGGGLASGNARR